MSPESPDIRAVVRTGARRALVLAAGLGMRLRPLTERLPKPALPLLHRPLAWFALDQLRRAGVEHAVLNSYHCAEALERALEAAPPLPGLSIAVVREERLLGTGGGAQHAIARQSALLGRDVENGEPILAFNGDVLAAPDILRAVEVHRALGAIATMVLRPDPDVVRYGAIEVDPQGRVRRILGAPERLAGEVPVPLAVRMFTGVQVLSARALVDLPEEGCIVRQGYQRWLARGEVIGAVVDPGLWRDLGRLPDYLAANLDLASASLHWPGIDAREAVHPEARIEPGAVVEHSVVGPGARVRAGVRLVRCVVWPGTDVRENARDAVIFEGGVVRA